MFSNKYCLNTVDLSVPNPTEMGEHLLVSAYLDPGMLQQAITIVAFTSSFVPNYK